MGENLSCGSWLCEMMEKVNNELVEQMGLILWYLCNECNNQMFNNKKLEEWEVVGNSLNHWDEFKSYYTKEMQEEEKQIGKLIWTKPPLGWDKINVDAATFAGRGSGFIVVVRNDAGHFQAAAIRRERTQWPLEIAELRAMQFGSTLAERLGLAPAIVESDCQTTILKMIGKETTKLEAGVVVGEMKEKAVAIGPIRWAFAKRECNRPTYTLAHLNCNWDSQEKWVGRPPVFLIPDLEHDALRT
ncbi:unnamed protein product [Linum trigynum]